MHDIQRMDLLFFLSCKQQTWHWRSRTFIGKSVTAFEWQAIWNAAWHVTHLDKLSVKETMDGHWLKLNDTIG